MQAVGVEAHINRAYASSSAYQWAREAVINAVQAGATRVGFDIEWEAVAAHQVYRRTIIDNGSGMIGHRMPAFLNKFGGSGRVIGPTTGNYGIGFKTSCLPWNKHGVVILTVNSDPENISRVNMMWLSHFSEGDFSDYGARELLVDFLEDKNPNDAECINEEWFEAFGKNEQPTTVLPLSLLRDKYRYEPVIDGVNWYKIVPEWMIKEGHGTVIVLLGNDPTEDTVRGDASRNEGVNKYDLQRYLNTRFYTLPEGLVVKVNVLGPNTKEGGWGDRRTWPRSPRAKKGISKRTVKGMKACLETMAEGKGEILSEESKLNGISSPVPVLVNTMLYPEVEQSEKAQGGYNVYTNSTGPSLPLIGYLRKCHDEIDCVETFDVKTLKDGKEALYPWINLECIRKRLAILLTPVDTQDVEVFPDQTRRTLLYQSKTLGGSPLPERDWINTYKQCYPQFINKAREEHWASLNAEEAVIPENVKRQMDQFFPYMASSIQIRRIKRTPNANDQVAETDEGQGGGGGGGGGGGSQGNDLPGRKYDSIRTVSGGLIEVRKATDKEIENSKGDAADYNRFPIIFDDAKPPKGIANMAHPLIADAWKMCEEERSEIKEAPEELYKNYRNAFESQVIAHIRLALSHLHKYARKLPKERDDLIKPQSLVSIVSGIRHLYQAAQGPFGTIKAGRAKVS